MQKKSPRTEKIFTNEEASTSEKISKSVVLKKSVSAIHTSGELSLLERKTANVLLLNAYNDLLKKRTHTISVNLLCAMLGFDSHDIELLKKAVKQLASTPIEFNTFKEGKNSWKVMSMISFGEIEKGICTYRYDEYLATRLYDPEIYATINMAVQRSFDSGYALTLYENCLRYKSVGSTGWWDIERFRTIMGATAAMYQDFKYLKRDVISKPINQINRVSDISITAEFKRVSRRVTDVRFLVTESAQQTLITSEQSDSHTLLRANPVYQRLMDHGIGDKLALYWILHEAERLDEIIDYVESKDQKNQVKGSTGGYIRKLVEDHADVTETTYTKDKQSAAKKQTIVVENEKTQARKEELKSDYQRDRTNEKIKAITPDQNRDYITLYTVDVHAKEGREVAYNHDTDTFRSAMDKTLYSIWLRQKVTEPIDAKGFVKWLKSKHGIDPKTIGI